MSPIPCHLTAHQTCHTLGNFKTQSCFRDARNERRNEQVPFKIYGRKRLSFEIAAVIVVVCLFSFLLDLFVSDVRHHSDFPSSILLTMHKEKKFKAVCSGRKQKEQNKTGGENHLKPTIRNGKMRDKKQNSASTTSITRKITECEQRSECACMCERE